jgi:hypothetical protein
MRPSKRARLSTHSNETKYGRLKCSQRRSIELLVDQLADIGVPTCEGDFLSDLLKSISGALRNNGIDNGECAQNLQRLLLLLLGFFMPSAASTPAPESGGVDTVLEVLRCMHNLYQHSSCQAFINPTERVESYLMILQLIHGANEEHHNFTAHLGAIHDQCFKIVNLLLRRDFSISQLLFENRFEIERLLSTLLLGGSEKTRQATVVKLLDEVSSFGPTANCLATLALNILKKTPMQQVQASSSVHDQLFCWKCILVFEHITVPRGVRILESLKKLYLSPTKTPFEKDSIRLGTLQCLHLLKKQLETLSDGAIVVHALLKCAIHDEAGLDLAFSWLFTLLKGQGKDFQHPLDSMELKRLLEFLASNAFRRNGLANIPAAKALVLIVSFKSKSFNLISPKEQLSFISLISDLLTANISVCVTESAVEIVEFLLDSQATERFVSVFQPKLSFALAKAASDEFATNAARGGAVRVFWKMVINNDAHMNSLSRTPKVLETLVAVASEQEMSAERKLAYSTLMRLSENVCNRRLLAKQPGLLASLIRYARSISQEMTDNPAVRNDIKKRILSLATAL